MEHGILRIGAMGPKLNCSHKRYQSYMLNLID